MELYFIRHTSVAVAPGICYGSSDVALSPTFAQEAEGVAERLSGIAFDHVFSSPLTRAVELARYCGHGQPTIDSRVSEVDYGRWEMQPYDQIPPEEIQPWYDNWRYVRPPDGESFHDQYLRVSDFINQVKRHEWERVAVFCHGGVLLCAAIYAGQLQFDQEYNIHFPYGGVLTISI
ncbi:MAG: alpha-ribazole phosphatase [Bacteroidales bacterium]|nr:alpha-ribazole phosphatase [Bacteroidales bacterium]